MKAGKGTPGSGHSTSVKSWRRVATLPVVANSLAMTHSKQGREDAAEELEAQVMEIRKDKLEADHPDTLTSMNNLTSTIKDPGPVAEAISLLFDCVRLQERVLWMTTLILYLL